MFGPAFRILCYSNRIPVHHVPLPAGSIFLNCPTEELPEGWTMHIHPGGKPYYYRIAQEPEPTLLVGVSSCLVHLLDVLT